MTRAAVLARLYTYRKQRLTESESHPSGLSKG